MIMAIRARLTTLGNVRNVVILEVEHSLGVLNHGRRVGSDKVLDGLRHAILGHESARLGSSDLVRVRVGALGSARHAKKSAYPDMSLVHCRQHGTSTRLTPLVDRELDIDKVHLQLSVRLDTDEQGRSSSRGDNLVREVGRLEHERKRALLLVSSVTQVRESTCQLLDNRLDQLGKVEALVRLAFVDVLTQDRDGLGVGVGLERVTPFSEDVLELLVVGNDTVVDQAKLRDRVADVGVTVARVRNTVRRPSRVGHGRLRNKHLGHVDLWRSAVSLRTGQGVRDALSNVLSQCGNLADLLEENDGGIRRVAVDSDSWGQSMTGRGAQDSPAESYPRYSSRARPLHSTSHTYLRSFSTRKEQYPKIPGMSVGWIVEERRTTHVGKLSCRLRRGVEDVQDACPGCKSGDRRQAQRASDRVGRGVNVSKWNEGMLGPG